MVYMLIIAPHHRVPVPVYAVEFFSADPIASLLQYLLARLMVNHHCPTRSQLWNTPGYHHELPVLCSARRGRGRVLVALLRHDELLSALTTQRLPTIS